MRIDQRQPPEPVHFSQHAMCIKDEPPLSKFPARVRPNAQPIPDASLQNTGEEPGVDIR